MPKKEWHRCAIHQIRFGYRNLLLFFHNLGRGASNQKSHNLTLINDMYPLTRINPDAHPDLKIPQPDSWSKYNLRPRKVANTQVAGRSAAPTLSTRRKRSDTRADWENVDGAPPPKKIRRDAPSDNPVYKARTGAIATQPGAAVMPRIPPSQPMETSEISALRNYLEGGQSEPQVKAVLLRNAAGAGWLEGFEVLVEHGALADYHRLHATLETRQGRTLFQEAIYGGNVALLNRLNQVDVNIHERSREELKCAIIWAVLHSDPGFIDLLFNATDVKGIRWDALDMSTFFNAVICREQIKRTDCSFDISGISYLTKRYPDSWDGTAFFKAVFSAIKCNHWDAASVLLSVYRASANVGNGEGVSLLMMSASAGQFDLYELLRFHDASPHAIDHNGNSVLHHAVRGGNDAIVGDLVLRCKVKPGTRNNDGINALDLATSLNLPLIQSLILNAPYASPVKL